MPNSKNKEAILNHELIKKIINDYKLNENQINSGLEIFNTIINESKLDRKPDFYTSIEVYDENNIIGIVLPNQEKTKELKWNKLSVLDNISNVDRNINFEYYNNNKGLDKYTFFWSHPKAKKENDRNELVKWCKTFFISIKNNVYHKGLYICGEYGVGKTFFLKALHNYIINNRKSCSFINTSDFLEFATRNIDNNSDLTFEAIQKLKNVDYLIIDDIGGEKTSAWFLFSILYPVLEYRLDQNKTVCFSSIFDPEGLHKYWKGIKELNKIKVERIIEKITSLSTSINLRGLNIRKL